jgi:hypothetical protein
MASEAVPASVASSVASISAADEAWALTTESGDVDLSLVVRSGWSLKEIRDKLGDAFSSNVKKFGGPMQFLANRYKDKKAKEEYGQRLWKEFPPLDNRAPHLEWPLPTVLDSERTTNSEVVLHLAQLDFTSAATLKGPPGLRTSLLLADDILTSGFITVGDPLLVNPLDREIEGVPGPWGVDQALSDAFSIGYIKGAARMCTLHMLVTLCLDDELPLHQVDEPNI